MSRLRSAAAACGAAAALVAALAVVAAILLAPEFSVAEDALSDLGVTPGAAPLFNGGLLVAGALLLPFSWYALTVAPNRLQAAGAALVAVGGVALAGVGAFPAGTRLHLPASIAFYAALTYALFLWGSGAVVAGHVDRGLRTLWLGIGHVSVWFVWAVALVPGGVTGVALPEAVGGTVFAAWAVTLARRSRPRSP